MQVGAKDSIHAQQFYRWCQSIFGDFDDEQFGLQIQELIVTADRKRITEKKAANIAKENRRLKAELAIVKGGHAVPEADVGGGGWFQGEHIPAAEQGLQQIAPAIAADAVSEGSRRTTALHDDPGWLEEAREGAAGRTQTKPIHSKAQLQEISEFTSGSLNDMTEEVIQMQRRESSPAGFVEELGAVKNRLEGSEALVEQLEQEVEQLSSRLSISLKNSGKLEHQLSESNS